MVMTNPPFDKNSSITLTNGDNNGDSASLTYERQGFWVTTSNKELNFFQHAKILLKINGKAAIVVPDNVLFEGVRRNSARMLKQIGLHTFRHWKATTEYHKTQSILHVQQLLGHRDLRNTLIYINLEKALFQNADDEFHVKVAQSLEEACKLLEGGFEYVKTWMDQSCSEKESEAKSSLLCPRLVFYCFK